MKRRRREDDDDEKDEEEEEGFVAWEEQVISSDKGSRRVHYNLSHYPSGQSIFAVEANERSIRHMTYTLPHAFASRYGDLCKVAPSTKWRARRDVVHWLNSLVSKHRRRLEKSAPPLNDDSSGDLIPGLPEMPSKKLKSQISEILWNGVGWACSKKLIHYRSFRRNGVDIKAHSFVFILAEEFNHYVGYIEDMYEDTKTQKKVKVRWFHIAEEFRGVESQVKARPREVIITPQAQVISAECIEGPASVLNPIDYDQCVPLLPNSILDRIHLCFRQLKNNMILPFNIVKLQGYYNQPVLACINHPLYRKSDDKAFDEGKLKDSTTGNLKHSHNRKRPYGEKDGGFKGRNHSMINNKSCLPGTSPSAFRSQVPKAVSSCPKLKIKLSGRVLKLGNFVGSQQALSPTYSINDDIEFLSQDSGIRGCWFRCKVLQVSRKHVKIEYYDVEDAENSGNLQEWVASCRVAASDKLGMRYTGRLTTRPRPPEDLKEVVLEVGAPVDVWWHDGWWEGIVTGTSVFGTGQLQIYLPGEDRYVTVEKSQVRAGKDWINGSWVDAKIKPDILSCISTKENHQGPSECELPPISELVEVKENREDPTNTIADNPVLASVQEDVTVGSRLCNGEAATEVGEQAVEL